MIDLELETKNSAVRTIQDELSPRDLLFLKNLTRHGLVLIEIRISPISPVIGKNIGEISLPEGSQLINVIHENQSLFPKENLELQAGDTLYLLAYQVVEEDLREVFIPKEIS